MKREWHCTVSLAVVLFIMFYCRAFAAIPQRFDLNCNGHAFAKSKQKIELINGKPSNLKEWRGTVHVDLIQMKYCLNDCKEIQPLTDLGPDGANAYSAQSAGLGDAHGGHLSGEVSWWPNQWPAKLWRGERDISFRVIDARPTAEFVLIRSSCSMAPYTGIAFPSARDRHDAR